MYINSISTTQLSSAVWAAATRTITDLAPNCISNSLLFNQSIATLTTVQISAFNPGFYLGYLAINAGAAGSLQLGIYDGFQNNLGVTYAQGTTHGAVFITSDGSGILYLTNNDSTNAAAYCWTAQQLQ